MHSVWPAVRWQRLPTKLLDSASLNLADPPAELGPREVDLTVSGFPLLA